MSIVIAKTLMRFFGQSTVHVAIAGELNARARVVVSLVRHSSPDSLLVKRGIIRPDDERLASREAPGTAPCQCGSADLPRLR